MTQNSNTEQTQIMYESYLAASLLFCSLGGVLALVTSEKVLWAVLGSVIINGLGLYVCRRWLPFRYVIWGYFTAGLISLNLIVYNTGGTIYSVFSPLYVAFASVINIVDFENRGVRRWWMTIIIFVTAVGNLLRWLHYDPPIIQGSDLYPLGYYFVMCLNILFSLLITTWTDMRVKRLLQGKPPLPEGEGIPPIV